MHGSNRTNLFTITAPDGQLSGGGLHGRRGERQTLDRLAANARSGHSQVLVLRGEPGIGKTALLDYLAGCAAGCRIARVAGAEPETELALAGLHQLCAPFLDRLGQLPGPQRDALRTAFSMRDGNLPDRFAVGLATLSLLAEVAAERPLICVIDDAHWLDRASAQVLGFVARHLAGVPLTVVFAVRQPDGEQDLAGLPELVVGALTDGDARALLHSAVIGPLDERVRDRIVAETRGNPLALLEVLAALPPAERAGGFGLPGTRPLDPRVEESYRRRLAPLPPATRLLLLIAAAELAGDPVTVWRAAAHLGLEPGTADPATAAGLIEFTGRVRFCHPSARAAIYQAASPRQRHDVHRALAQATDPEVNPDRRAWHLGHATPGLDEDVAAGLRARGLTEVTGAAATDWALGILARSRALLADGEPEPLYLEAIERLGRTRIRAELARAHLLYGEWLRRHGRRSAAREQLRTAYEMLDAMGIAAFAERARRELVATGETARKRTTVTADGLTAQETQIAMLACHGHSNPEISTQLFISPRTVEWHLRKVFGKLGISSRKELRTVLPDLGQVPLSA